MGCAWEGGVELVKQNSDLLIIAAAGDGVTYLYSLFYFCVGLKKGREIALMGRVMVMVG